MKIKVGERLPISDFFYLDSSGSKKIKSSELFNDQKVIVIGVPGAFTKVCSAKHLPGYVDNFEEDEEVDLDEVSVGLKEIDGEIELIDKEINRFCDELGIKSI